MKYDIIIASIFTISIEISNVFEKLIALKVLVMFSTHQDVKVNKILVRKHMIIIWFTLIDIDVSLLTYLCSD